MLFGLLAMAIAAISITVIFHIGSNTQQASAQSAQQDSGNRDDERQNYNERKQKEALEDHKKNRGSVSSMQSIPVSKPSKSVNQVNKNKNPFNNHRIKQENNVKSR